MTYASPPTACASEIHSTYEIPSATLQKSLQRILEIFPLRVQISSQIG